MAGTRARPSDGLPRSEWAFPTPPKPWAEAFEGDAAFLFSKIGARSRKLFAQALEPLGLRPNHVAVLQYQHVCEGASPREVVDGRWIDASALVALLDEFEERGLAERRRNPQDRRAYAVHLTAAGREALAEARALSRDIERRLLAPLAASERRQLHGLLARVVGGGR